MFTVSLFPITWLTFNSGSDGGSIKFEMYHKINTQKAYYSLPKNYRKYGLTFLPMGKIPNFVAGCNKYSLAPMEYFFHEARWTCEYINNLALFVMSL